MEAGIPLPGDNPVWSHVTQSCIYSPTSRLPRKLVERIQNLELIEMSEMLPETWLPDTQDGTPAPRIMSHRTPVTDILVWAEGFVLMAAVLAERFPGKPPQLWAYLRCIVHAA